MIVITTRFPANHPINNVPIGQRSKMIRELVDIALLFKDGQQEILEGQKMIIEGQNKLVEELANIRELIKQNPVAYVNETQSKEEETKTEIQFDINAFMEEL